ncbi:hypothetical protein POL68_33875 [Stigmatella sp. ncwal1]|uniref:Ig-like domain-containing protein n=1 Tax=Stigmatella ashevillensis TaxID=2995309 RepID=A0ABT5DK49_9BACT|nr:hypothetical protein [Stigmatella ashevillena]MDC0713503.1 hypothetical protein [Stigmatella ashevillena]
MSAIGPQGRGIRQTRTSAAFICFSLQYPRVTGLLCLTLVIGLLPSTAHAEDSVLSSEPTVVPVEQTALPAEPTVVPVEQTVLLAEPTVVPAEPTALPSEPTVVPAEPTALPAEPAVVLARGTPLVTCAGGSQHETYSPPLMLSPQDVTLTATGQFSSCAAFDGSGPTSGQYTVRGIGTASCLTSSIATTSHITWSDGTTSTVEFGKSMDAKQGVQAVAVIVGLVIEGRYVGSLAVGGFVLETAPNALHCLSEGVPSASGLSFLKLIQQ